MTEVTALLDLEKEQAAACAAACEGNFDIALNHLSAGSCTAQLPATCVKFQANISKIPHKMTQVPVRRKLIAFIDGFNLYYGIVKDQPHLKWLNFNEMLRKMFPDDDIVAIKFFTARVDDDGRRNPSARRTRQDTYCKALSNSGVVVIDGRIEIRGKKCEARQCTMASPQWFDVQVEKMTDVNIALNLVEDSVLIDPGMIVVISGDTDLLPALKKVRELDFKSGKRRQKRVYIPCSDEKFKFRRVDEFGNNGWITNRLDEIFLAGNMFPPEITCKDGTTLKCPTEWLPRVG